MHLHKATKREKKETSVTLHTSKGDAQGGPMSRGRGDGKDESMPRVDAHKLFMPLSLFLFFSQSDFYALSYASIGRDPLYL